jgi:hypothetical protein
MELVFKDIELIADMPMPLQIELLKKSVNKNILLAINEWEFVVGHIKITSNYQPGAIHEFGDLDGRCLCGTAIRYVYRIRNKLNNFIIPENPSRDDGIGCICLKNFIPNAKSIHLELVRIENKKKRKRQIEEDRKENPTKYCFTCKSNLKDKPYCKKCLDEKFNCVVIDCKRKKLKFDMCRTCCKDRKLLK